MSGPVWNICDLPSSWILVPSRAKPTKAATSWQNLLNEMSRWHKPAAQDSTFNCKCGFLEHLGDPPTLKLHLWKSLRLHCLKKRNQEKNAHAEVTSHNDQRLDQNYTWKLSFEWQNSRRRPVRFGSSGNQRESIIGFLLCHLLSTSPPIWHVTVSLARSNRDTGRLTETLSPWGSHRGQLSHTSFPGSPSVLWYLVRMTCDLKNPEKCKFLHRWHSSFQKEVPNATLEDSTSWNENRTPPPPEEGLRFWVPCGAVRDHNEKESVLGQAAPYVSTEPNAAKHFTAPCVTLQTSSIACVLLL